MLNLRTTLSNSFRAALRATKGESRAWFDAVLRELPGEVGGAVRNRLTGYRAGERSRVLTGVTIYEPRRLRLGRDVGIARGCQLNASGTIIIGNDVLIGPGTMIWSQNHNYEALDISIRDQGYTRAEVRIDDGVWIAAGCIILPGVHLGKGTVVAAGSVVTKPTEPFTIVGGVPARPIGHRNYKAASADERKETS